MHATAPSPLEVDEGVARITRNVNTRLNRGRTLRRVGVGAGLVALLGVGSAGVAIAVSPSHPLNLDGMVTTTYAAALASCVSDAGWPTVVLPSSDANSILRSNDLDPASVSVVRTVVTSTTEASAGHAITRCQQQVAKANGVASIVPF